MSLINKMLQDLDARHSDLSAGGGIPGQVKAVPKRDGIHSGWWIALVLALLLGGGAAWLSWRQSSPVVAAITPRTAPQASAAQPAPSMSVATLPIAVASAPQVISPSPAGSVNSSDSEALPADAAVQSGTNIALGNQLKLDRQLNDTVLINAVRTTGTAAAARAKPSAAPKAKATAGKSEVSPMPAESFDSKAPSGSGRQVKELSLQQLAENEYRKAISLVQQGRAPEAIGGLEKTIQLDAQHAAARQTLVELLLETRRQDEATSRLQEGLALDPNQPGLGMILARLQVEKGEIRPALDTLHRTLPHAADRADYQAFLAALLQREGRHKEAIEHYGLAVRKMPQNGLWWMGLGISLQAEKRLPEARDAFSRAKASSTLSSELLAFVEQQLNQLR